MADVMVVSVDDMDDETLIRHLESRHADDLRMSFQPDPDTGKRTLAAPKEWRTYHQSMHRLYPRKYEHRHRDVARG